MTKQKQGNQLEPTYSSSEDTGCSLRKAMNEREEWRERVRDIHADGTTKWWWYSNIWNHLTVCKKELGLFFKILSTKYVYKCVCVWGDLALNDLQWLICYKTKPNFNVIDYLKPCITEKDTAFIFIDIPSNLLFE